MPLLLNRLLNSIITEHSTVLHNVRNCKVEDELTTTKTIHNEQQKIGEKYNSALCGLQKSAMMVKVHGSTTTTTTQQ